jgi:tight adherence protein B
MNVLLVGIVIFIFCLFVIELTAYAIRIIRHPDRAEIRKRLRRSVATESEADASQDITKKRGAERCSLSQPDFASAPRGRSSGPFDEAGQREVHLGLFYSSLHGSWFTGYLFFFILMKNARFFALLLAGLSKPSAPNTASEKEQENGQVRKTAPGRIGVDRQGPAGRPCFYERHETGFGGIRGPSRSRVRGDPGRNQLRRERAEALKNLAHRVDCPDVKFFVVSVILQRETGGNLAEIIESLAHLIRERFKFRGKVRVLSAEGRLSSIILLAIPVFMFLFLYITHRAFLDPLFF